MTQPKPTEIANKLAVSANRRGMPSRQMKFFATEIEADLLRFSLQQSEELVRALEFIEKKLKSVVQEHEAITSPAWVESYVRECHKKSEAALATYHANQQEGRG